MMLTFYDTNCCGVKEIQGISNYRGKPFDLIADLVEHEWDGTTYKSSKGVKGYFYSHYLFNDAIYSTRPESAGHELAKYITDNKLGTVTASPSVVNYAYHRDHEVMVWIWTVDHDALKQWQKNIWRHRYDALKVNLERYEVAMKTTTSTFYRNYYQNMVTTTRERLAKMEAEYMPKEALPKTEPQAETLAIPESPKPRRARAKKLVVGVDTFKDAAEEDLRQALAGFDEDRVQEQQEAQL